MADRVPRINDEMALDKLPGGHQSLMGALPQALKNCLERAARVVLVANNPAITAADFQALDIGSDDVVVTFNTCVKSALLRPHSVNVFVHGFNAPDAYFFGLPYNAEVQRLFGLPDARCFTMLVGCTGNMSPLPGVTLYWERMPLPPLWNYPVDREGGKRYVGPSTGFNALVLFDWLRGHAGYNYQIFTLGFSNEAGKFWSGHAWEYERQWLLGADVTVVPLQRCRWWQRWFRRP
ncbi:MULTISPECIES: hypothetical protein [Pseudomonas]|jgi:hypothetical protein|uniref:Uncharacterized protein n=1 Tax=Pseudomonas canavaninivorans TaxID=2842348 RepID=A0ABX8QFB7_PSECO|nr:MULTISPECIES: hypothetical protein [Pseudomonas]MBJ2347977.1 hypothetical protein [Pseudomonas canavaninivorans]MBL3542040.1 hypothetical protein [Pseudomonas sp. HB05]QXI54056.1 hypothetical protein KSS97_03625 [Pseudomonas alvandae]UVM73109.1 hypothetical protein LOY40_02730 [Pseudomonas canavaninivorans]